MASDDYTPSIGGGLKLKGSKPTGVTKKKKKDKKAKSEDSGAAIQKALKEVDKEALKEFEEKEGDAGEARREAEEELGHGKTEAEKRRDEMRRKRLAERLEKEGSKSHKERVEELNRYLSSLSEHHDMPKIGPG
ncbi:hypothetical protein BP6252_10517 [Coleophoma cylindrospora]|uniref:DUF1754-domain-containing protein n=1 Tax=Coleophoma cylindrospora TaxID=1849047 RepID=A0A3D8QSR1_9HELO|nr:hypothetical protein BP6252_10517 [Coleophoma cylindrospora]